MFAKLCAVILALGATGCALLALRQSRLQAASELAQAQIRIDELDERLWELRAKIAAGTTPRRIEEAAAGLGPLRPMVPGLPSAEEAEDGPSATPIPIDQQPPHAFPWPSPGITPAPAEVR